MADKSRSGSARFGTILQCLKKLMPQFEEEFIDNVPYVLKISEDDDIARKEWTQLFNFKERTALGGSSSPERKPREFNRPATAQKRDQAGKAKQS